MRPALVLCGIALAAGVPATLLQAQVPAPEIAKAAEAPKADAKADDKSKTDNKAKAAKKPKSPPARLLFGAAKAPAPLAARAIGFYAKGCLAGAQALPIDGPAWQAMRLSRNRNWGHPDLLALVEKLAVEAKAHDGWAGLLVGDLSQPRGGPMLTGHASHQIGLDADIWLNPMPDRRLTEKEREELSAVSMLAADRVSVDPAIWTEAHVRILKRASSYPEVERVLVHPAIKKALCEATAKDKDRAWVSKVRPYWGHHYHFHVRIACPKGSSNCEAQPAPGSDDGCGKELQHWLALVKVPPKPGPPGPGKPAITMDQLPAECRTVLASGTDTPPSAPEPAKGAKPAKKAGSKKASAGK
jgi:penicillin-insensitive murein DD-endopeptidase